MKRIMTHNPLSRLIKAKYANRLVDYMYNRHLPTILDKNYCILHYQRLGNALPSRLFYRIDIDAPDGFFALYLWLLGYLMYAEAFHLEPVVMYSKKTPFYDESYTRVSGLCNPFDYYFEPLVQEPLALLNEAQNVVFSRRAHLMYVRELFGITYQYALDDTQLLTLAQQAKRVRFNQSTKEAIKHVEAELNLPSKVIGVHFRGSDYRYNLHGHPVFTDETHYFETLDTLLGKFPDHVIFLASDDSHALNAFKSRYQDKLYHVTGSVRSDSLTNTVFQKNARPFHNYQTGLDVLIDCHLLSTCEVLVCGPSNVASGARILKASRDEHFLEVILLNKGLNVNHTTLETVDLGFKAFQSKNQK